MVFNWYGDAGEEIKSGEFMVSPAPKSLLFFVLSARPVKVVVSRGETLRQRLELVAWPWEDLPAGSKVTRWRSEPKTKRR
jgi:hypothetical protein